MWFQRRKKETECKSFIFYAVFLSSAREPGNAINMTRESFCLLLFFFRCGMTWSVWRRLPLLAIMRRLDFLECFQRDLHFIFQLYPLLDVWVNLTLNDSVLLAEVEKRARKDNYCNLTTLKDLQHFISVHLPTILYYFLYSLIQGQKLLVLPIPKCLLCSEANWVWKYCLPKDKGSPPITTIQSFNFHNE